MPYMQRITWSGIALHAGDLPGYPASHGCIRLTNDFAIRLWHLTKRGTRVIIAHEDIRPVEITNPQLFVPKPKVASASPESRHCQTLASDDSVTGRDNACDANIQLLRRRSAKIRRPGFRGSAGSKGGANLCFCESPVEQALRATGLHAPL